ncbi:hypothetical protein EV424DRAFT_1542479 [Suillus variegatus]|nr:hypothetical protein EV424DRAFT_1542479 [Suillus variegatus]
MDDEDLVELEEKLEMDYQIGKEIILRAIDYFTGKALEDDFDELDDEDEKGQFNDEDSDSEVDSLPRHRGPLKGRGGSSAGAVNLEKPNSSLGRTCILSLQFETPPSKTFCCCIVGNTIFSCLFLHFSVVARI